MTTSVTNKQGGSAGNAKKERRQTKRDATRVNTVINVRSAGKKKANAKSQKPGAGAGKGRKDATRVSTIIYVRGAAKKKASEKTGAKSTKKAGKRTAAARPRRERVRVGK